MKSSAAQTLCSSLLFSSHSTTPPQRPETGRTCSQPWLPIVSSKPTVCQRSTTSLRAPT